MSAFVASKPRDSSGAVSSETAGPVHFVYHVPKCAGRTIDRHLARTLPLGAYHRMRKQRGLGRFIARHDRAKLPDPSTVSVVSGHHLGISVDRLFVDRTIKRSILLRDPVSHFVSYYNYRMTRYIAEGLQPYGIDVAYGAMQRNFVTHYILRNFLELSWADVASLSDTEKFDVVNAFLATFWFVGDYRHCDDFVSTLGSRLGIPTNARPFNTHLELSRGVGWTPLTVDLLPAQMLNHIRRANALDQRLWETWHEAHHDTASIRPAPISGQPSNFLAHEVSRFVNQIARRIQRRWGGLSAPVPSAHGDTATPF